MRVQVYFNSHKKLWSIREKISNKVIYHKQRVVLTDVKFIVRESGRKRVLSEKRKNVHAWAEGEFLQNNKTNTKQCNVQIAYNPYVNYYFATRDNPSFQITDADVAIMKIVDNKPIVLI
jgi:hypothetical protein